MAKTVKTHGKNRLPIAPVERVLAPIKRFLEIEAASGLVLLACTIAALVLANSPWAAPFKAIWKTPVSLTWGGFSLAGDVGHLVVTDGLMTIFFFVVGLEIKREIIFGELREWRKALLPVVAALGGALLPAAIFSSLQWGQPAARGWAIPMATDIAFVVGFLALFGSRVPFGLKIFLLTLAIADDLMAVLVIAFVFTEKLAWSWIMTAVAGFLLTYTLNRAGVRQVGVYVAVGAGIWLAVLKSGVHPTVAGVLLGLLTPASAWVGRKTLAQVLEDSWKLVRGDNTRSAAAPDEDEEALVSSYQRLQFAAREAISPLHRLEAGLHPWVAFGIMPIFALANAGVALDASKLTDPVAIAVAAGLVIGKPVGILAACGLTTVIGLTVLPAGVSWRLLAGGGCLAGIGFTMALFLNTLAFGSGALTEYETAGKIGILAGSAVSALLGSILILTASTSDGTTKSPASS